MKRKSKLKRPLPSLIGLLIGSIGMLVIWVYQTHVARSNATADTSKIQSPLALPSSQEQFVPGSVSEMTAQEAASKGWKSAKILSPTSGYLFYSLTSGATGETALLIRQDISRDMKAAGQIAPLDKANRLLVYPLKKTANFTAATAFSPVWSPNGRSILIKYGTSDELTSGYRLFVWDTEIHQLVSVSNEYLSNPNVSWSPDSNYIAFIKNGNAEGQTETFGQYCGPLELYLCNWRTGQTQLVSTNDTLTGPLSWITPHTLVYGVLPDQAQQPVTARQPAPKPAQSKSGRQSPMNPEPKANMTTVQQNQAVLRPNIYAYSIENDKTELLIKDGYKPVVSPDGQWIAFYGSEHPEKPAPLAPDWQVLPRGMALSVAHRTGSNRVALNREYSSYLPVQWLPDDKHVITLQGRRWGSHAQGIFKEWDTQTRHFRIVASLYANDYEPLPWYPHFSSFSVSKSGVSLWTFVYEITGHKQETAPYTVATSLQSVNLKTGSTATITRMEDIDGIDWYDPSTPLPTDIYLKK